MWKEQEISDACGAVSWSRLIVGEDYSTEMRRLVLNLTNHPANQTGDGRFIDSGHAYWGVGPTMAWRRACQDQSYPVGQQSLETFPNRWQNLLPGNGDQLPTTFVSLGPGTGEKDFVIMESLGHITDEPAYIAVDISGEMLRLKPETPDAAGWLRRMVRIKVDFSLESNVRHLRQFLDKLLGEKTPILFGLLGNTIANFSDDQKQLDTLVNGLLTHDDDRLLLEVATAATIDEIASNKAEMEYRGAPLFLDWVTSALTTHTSLIAEHEAVKFLPFVEEERALALKVVYANTLSDATTIKLANGTSFSFQPEDTIRLELTRKYDPDAITRILEQAGLAVCDRQSTELPADDGSGGFGLELLLVRRDPNASSSAGVRFFGRR